MSERNFLILFAFAVILTLGGAKLNAAEEISGEEAKNIKNSIETYIKDDINLKGGFFIYDKKEKKTLILNYDHVHDGVKRVESGEYFACVDFVDDNKNSYDIDFYIDKKDSAGLYVSNIVLHKVNGESLLK